MKSAAVMRGRPRLTRVPFAPVYCNIQVDCAVDHRVSLPAFLLQHFVHCWAVMRRVFDLPPRLSRTVLGKRGRDPGPSGSGSCPLRDGFLEIRGELVHRLLGLLADDRLAELADAPHDLGVGLHAKLRAAGDL